MKKEGHLTIWNSENKQENINKKKFELKFKSVYNPRYSRSSSSSNIFFCYAILCRKKLFWFRFISFTCIAASIYFLIYYYNGLIFSIRRTSDGIRFNIGRTGITNTNIELEVLKSNTERSVNFTKVYSTISTKLVNSGVHKIRTITKTPISTLSTTKITSRSLVSVPSETIGCHLPNLRIFDPSVRDFVEEPNEIKCESTEHPLIFETDLNSNLIVVNNPTDFGLKNCCYKALLRKEFNDDGYEYSINCVSISQTFTKIPREYEYIGVFCSNGTVDNESKFEFTNYSYPIDTGSSNSSGHQIIDIFGFVPLKPEVEDRIRKSNAEDKPKVKQSILSVVILGLDAISHMNFIRTMPKTFKYLTTKLSAIGMEGYVKVGDNTFPNLVPVLTGLNVSELESTCWNSKEPVFDDCPFIWKTYSAYGFRTSYGEDAALMSTFNYGKYGFMNPPTDYYLRPMLLAQELEIAHRRPLVANMCSGPRLALNVLLDNIQKMATTMVSGGSGQKRNYFQFIWSNSMSHDDLNAPKLGDDLVLSALVDLQSGGFLNHTIFVLMSDHGIRWGDIRETQQGKIEERMPLLYFAFPDWFSKKYTDALQNLKLNVKRLTTPFDLHETLKDLITPEDYISNKEIQIRHFELQQQQSSLPRGISLFLLIPLSRTCEAAEISEHWCICDTTISISVNSPKAKMAANTVILNMNKQLRKYPQCSELKLFLIKHAEIVTSVQLGNNNELDVANINNPKNTTKNLEMETLTLTFETVPGHATFETTVKHDSNDIKNDSLVIGPISRTNLYGNQSHCVADYETKKYCYCS